jgi:hypothetical protein
MPVQSHRGGWRARKKYAGQWFRGVLKEVGLDGTDGGGQCSW